MLFSQPAGQYKVVQWQVLTLNVVQCQIMTLNNVRWQIMTFNVVQPASLPASNHDL